MEHTCPECGSKLRLRSGKYGDFWGCTNYPDCDYTCNEDEFEERSLYEETFGKNDDTRGGNI